MKELKLFFEYVMMRIFCVLEPDLSNVYDCLMQIIY